MAAVPFFSRRPRVFFFIVDNLMFLEYINRAKEFNETRKY